MTDEKPPDKFLCWLAGAIVAVVIIAFLKALFT